MGIRPIRHKHAIIDANGEAMAARLDRPKIVDVWRNETSIRSDFLLIEPNSRLPVRPLEREHHTTVGPIALNHDVALVPCYSNIMPRRLRQERDLDVLLGVVFVILAQIPVAIIKRQDPRGTWANLITIVLPLQNAGQLYVTAQIST